MHGLAVFAALRLRPPDYSLVAIDVYTATMPYVRLASATHTRVAACPSAVHVYATDDILRRIYMFCVFYNVNDDEAATDCSTVKKVRRKNVHTTEN